MCVCVGSEDNFVELVWFSPSTFVRGSEDQIQVIRLSNKCFYPLNHFTGLGSESFIEFSHVDWALNDEFALTRQLLWAGE